jgi:hypothetical protein
MALVRADEVEGGWLSVMAAYPLAYHREVPPTLLALADEVIE